MVSISPDPFPFTSFLSDLGYDHIFALLFKVKSKNRAKVNLFPYKTYNFSFINELNNVASRRGN